MVTKGEMTEAQAREENQEAVMRARVELSTEEFEEFARRIGLGLHRYEKELSELGRPIPGNDPQKPN